MPSDPASVLGKRVRLLPDGYLRLLLQPNDWTGTVVAVRQSGMGNPMQYLIRFDEHVRPKEEDVYVFEHEFEQV